MESNFTIRLGNKEDLPFIFSTWLKSFRYSSSFAKEIDNETYYKFHQQVIERILSRSPSIYIACDQLHPDTVFGYIVYEGPVLHFAYVKKSFRKLGIARALLPYTPDFISHLTKD